MEDKYLDIEEGNQTELVDGERETLNPTVNQEAKPIYVADPNRTDIIKAAIENVLDIDGKLPSNEKGLLVPAFYKKDIENICIDAILKAIEEGTIHVGGGEEVEGGVTLQFLDGDDKNFYVFSGKPNSQIDGLEPLPIKNGISAKAYVKVKNDPSTAITFPYTLTTNEKFYPIYLKLPIEYQEVEYIKSTGTQYINTGVLTKTTTNSNLKVSLIKNENIQKYLFGSFGSNRCAFNHGEEDNVWYYQNGEKPNVKITYEYVDEDILNIGLYNTYCEMNGNTYQAGPRNNDDNLSIYLFTTSIQTGAYNQMASMKLYSCEIREESVLVRSFVPCYRKADNKPGLYDLVNDVFYTNAGSDDFVVGGDVNA